MRRTRMMLVAAVAAVSLSAAGTGVAQAQTNDDLAEQCASYNIIEWLFFHHECHGHGGTLYPPGSWW